MYKITTLVVTIILNNYGRGHNVSLVFVSIVLIGIWILDQFAVFTHKSLIIPVNASQRANMRRCTPTVTYIITAFGHYRTNQGK